MNRSLKHLISVSSLATYLVVFFTGMAGAQFGVIRIGDVDGFGFGEAPGLVRPTPFPHTSPANVAANDASNNTSVLANGDFIPDLDKNGAVGSASQMNEFDLRSAAEVAGNFVTGIGFTDFGSRGSDFTDISLSDKYETVQNAGDVVIGVDPNSNPIRGSGGPFPDPNGEALPNQPGFLFRFVVADTDIDLNEKFFFNMVFGDYDVNPASVVLTLIGGDTHSASVNPTLGQDALIQSLFLTFDPLDPTNLNPSDLFTSAGGGFSIGHLGVDFIADNEPFTAFDYVELSVDPIPEPTSLVLALLAGTTTALGRRRRNRA